MNTKLTRRAVLGAVSLLAVSRAKAEDWPARNVTVVVPVPAGVASDSMARIVMEQVGKQLGQTFVVENRTGAGGTIGANTVAKAAPDGYTTLVYGGMAGANAIFTKLPYDTLHDFIAILPFGQQPLAVVAAPGRFKSLADLIATAKAKPGGLNFSTVGVGSVAHFGAERFNVAAGIKAQHIPFKGGEWLTETIAGRIDYCVPPIATAIGALRDNKLVALAVGSAKRSPMLPEAPTLIEAGLGADAIYPFYSGLYVPAKTPSAIVERLYSEVVKALAVPSVQERLTKLGVEPMPMTTAEFQSFFKKDVADNLALVKAANIPTQ